MQHQAPATGSNSEIDGGWLARSTSVATRLAVSAEPDRAPTATHMGLGGGRAG